MRTKLADRVADLEREVEALKKTAARASEEHVAHQKDGWRETVGAYEGSAYYDDVIRMGRSWRRRQPKC
jgi:hypothetical protein